MADVDGSSQVRPTSWIAVGFAWLMVSIPLLWGIWQTVKKATVLFR
jgi:hypothetical protein